MVILNQVTPVPINSLPAATTITGNEPTAIVQGGATVQAPISQYPQGMSAGVVVFGNTGGSPFPNYRTLKAGNNVSLTDGGAQGDLTITFTGAGSGIVTTVNGTADRITSSGGAAPIIDIASTYVGQTSIITLGTISTGTWSGTDIAFSHIAQGTALSVLGVTGNATADLAPITGTANQILRVNSAGTGLTFGGTINGVSIGATTPSTGAFTDLSASGTGTVSLNSSFLSGGGGISLLATNGSGCDISLNAIGGSLINISSNDGGGIDGLIIGASSPKDGSFENLSAGGATGISTTITASGSTFTVTNGIITGVA